MNGFTQGFDLGYQGPTQRVSKSRNIPFTVGNKTILWNKLMKEIQLKRVAGPFGQVPFDCYIQSPIVLVPKSGNKTRLIFHLSYNFGPTEAQKSVNFHTPKHLCSVRCCDLDHAVTNYLRVRAEEMRNRLRRGDTSEEPVIVYGTKSDLKGAFRGLPLRKGAWPWLITSVQNPVTGEWCYFVDKCLPFGASISCALFQRFSDALKHIVQVKTCAVITNYLDDFLFIAITIVRCNYLVQQFLVICEFINFPVSHTKTEWASELLTFLGILLNSHDMLLRVPLEKKDRAIAMFQVIKDRHKVTVKDLQILCGYLNFLNKAIFPGRAFTRRMYTKYAGCLQQGPDAKLKQYHHIRLDQEFKADCTVWLEFLNTRANHVVCQPMVDLTTTITADELLFFSDASAAEHLGYGCIFWNRWLFGKWEDHFIKQKKPSIAFLELFALAAGVLTWKDSITNCQVILFCDNQSVVQMINNMSSKCGNCMTLIRMLVLDGLRNNRRIFARYISTKQNYLADSLSCLQIKKFHALVPSGTNRYPDLIMEELWPISKLLIDY